MPLSSEIRALTASDGLKLAFVEDDFTDPWGPHEPLILIHAAMGSSRRLYKWVPILSRDFRVVRPDMRGHGTTEIPGPDRVRPLSEGPRRSERLDPSENGAPPLAQAAPLPREP